MVAKMEGAAIIADNPQPKAKAKAAAKAKSKGSQNGASVDSFRLCSEEVATLHTNGSKRVKTFVDVVLGSASYVTNLIDRDFGNACSRNMFL